VHFSKYFTWPRVLKMRGKGHPLKGIEKTHHVGYTAHSNFDGNPSIFACFGPRHSFALAVDGQVLPLGSTVSSPIMGLLPAR